MTIFYANSFTKRLVWYIICEMDQTNNRKKIDYITFLQSFAIFCIVLGHLTPIKISSPDNLLYYRVIRELVYSFHLPLFFLISGFLFYLTYKFGKSYLEYFKKKCKKILIPFFGLTALAVVLKIVLFHDFVLSSKSLTDLVLYPGTGGVAAFWFIIALFWLLILAPCFKYLQENHFKVFIIFTVLAGIVSAFMGVDEKYNYFGILNSIHFLFYFLAGMLMCSYKETITKFLSDRRVFAAFLIIFSVLMVIYQFMYHTHLIKFILSIIGIAGVFGIALICSEHGKKFLFGWIDGYYYQIYLIHSFIHLPLKALYKAGIISYNAEIITALFALIIIPILITKAIRKYAPALSVFIGL